jgi:hypothetical protein
MDYHTFKILFEVSSKEKKKMMVVIKQLKIQMLINQEQLDLCVVDYNLIYLNLKRGDDDFSDQQR